MVLLQYLKQPTFLMWWGGGAFLLFDLIYIMAASLPGHRNNMCVEGANIYPANIAFFALFAVLFGFLITSLVHSFGTYRQTSGRSTVLSVLGGIFGFFASFCGACTLPLLGVLGGSSVLFFLAEHDVWIKIAAILWLLVGILMLEYKLQKGCRVQ